MNYDQVQINKAENGFIVSTTKIDLLEKRPVQTVSIFKTFDEVVEFLKK